MSLTLKFSLFTSVLSIVLIGALGYLSYVDSVAEVEQSVGERLEAIAATAAIGIDGTLHDQIRNMEDAESEAYVQIRDHLRAVKLANNLSEDIYTFRRVGEQVEFVVMSHEKPFIGDTYSIRTEMRPTLNDGTTAHTGVYEDVHGIWISAYAPILDREGRSSGLLEVDIHVEEFLAITRSRSIALLWKGAVFAVAAIVLSFVLAKTVTRRLVRLTDITEKISLGKMDTQITVTGKDEVAKLGRALDRMRESVKIAADLLQ